MGLSRSSPFRQKKQSEEKAQSGYLKEIHTFLDKDNQQHEPSKEENIPFMPSIEPSSNKQQPIQTSGGEPSSEPLPPKKFAKVIVKADKSRLNWNRAGLYLAALAIIGIIFFSQMADTINPAFVILIWIFGMMCFLPLGIILGWLFLDPYMRCKIMRRFRGKNYGIVGFVDIGSQRITERIKNFDDDVIVQGERLWIINKEGVHYLDKDGNKVFDKKIDPESLKTLPANIPLLFLDAKTMNPITFHKTDTASDPQAVGSLLLGYVYAQVLKNKGLRRNTTVVFLLILGMVILNLVLTFQLYTWLEELYTVIPALKAKITQLGQLLATINPPQIIQMVWWW